MSTPYNDVHVTLDNDNTPILVDGQGNRVLDSDGNPMTLWPHRPITVCDNRLMDRMHPKPERLTPVPNRKARRKARKGGAK
jgi:hypothetical protein